MQKATPSRQLPIVLPPAADEILSSWIGRHAAFYGVPPMTMLQHCLPQATSLRAVDLCLTRKQAEPLAHVFRTKPDVVLRMGFTTVTQASHRLIAPKPIQSCPKCTHDANDTMTVTRTQVLGWRLCCSSCGFPLQGHEARERPSPFCSYWSAARRGEELLDAEAESGRQPWASPIDIARLLLMRSNPKTVRPEKRNSSPRILGVILPELEAVVANSRTSLPSPANLILPLNLRPALLAGIAIVERAGPAILEMLHAYTLGENRAHFGKLAVQMLAQNCMSADPQQLQLI